MTFEPIRFDRNRCRNCHKPLITHRRTGNFGKTDVSFVHEMGVLSCGDAMPMIQDEYVYVLMAMTPYDGVELIGTFFSLDVIKKQFNEMTWYTTEFGITAVFPDEIVVEAFRSTVRFI